METSFGNVFVMPEIELGDMILYHPNPAVLKNPILGWVSRRPGSQTVYALVFTENAGFVEKPSVRHVDDPGLKENAAWAEWGAWEHHPQTALLKKFKALLPKLAALVERQGKHQ
jgi:hypothetical protein